MEEDADFEDEDAFTAVDIYLWKSASVVAWTSAARSFDFVV